MPWRRLICCLYVVALFAVARADTLVVAEQGKTLATPLIWEAGEVLAPLAAPLQSLGIKTTVTDATVTLAAVGVPAITLTIGSTTASVGGGTFMLPVPPRLVDDTLYLPVKALAPLLQLTVTCDQDHRTVTLLPLLHVTYETRPTGLAVLLRCAAALTFTSASLDNPPRTYFDFPGVALGMDEQQLPVQEGGVQRLRLTQRSTGVRLVLDLLKPLDITASAGDQGHSLTILASVNLPKLPPVITVSGAAQHAELLIATGADVTDEYDAAARLLTLTFAKRLTISASTLAALHHALIGKVTLQDKPLGTVLTIALQRVVTYQLTRDTARVRLCLDLPDLSGLTVVLDAGHGGKDPGALGLYQPEKDVNLDVILRAAKLLQAMKATVLLSRSDDTFVDLSERTALANTKKANVFVAVHCNSCDNADGGGTQSYYSSAPSKQLAALLQEQLLARLGFADGGVHYNGDYVVINETQMPAVLLELGFVSNPHEAKLLDTPAVRQRAAEAIADGLSRYAAEEGDGNK